MLTKSDIKRIMKSVGRVKEMNHVCENYSTHTTEHCSEGAYDREIIDVKELEKILLKK